MAETELHKRISTYPKADLANWQSALLCGSWVLIEKYPPEDMTPGGIHLVDSAVRQYDAAHVLKVGIDVPCGVGRRPIMPGDTVLVASHAMMTLPDLGEDVGYVQAEDIVMVYPGQEG